MSDCSFCRIVADEAPASCVYEDDLVTAFLDIQPINPGHVLVVPNVHASTLGQIPVSTACRMMEVAHRLTQALYAADLSYEAANLFLADGAAAGQEVEHTHLHIIPRVAGDGFGMRFSHAYGTRPEREMLDQLAARIRATLDKV